jgi:hypothetical protein
MLGLARGIMEVPSDGLEFAYGGIWGGIMELLKSGVGNGSGMV